MRAEPQLQGLMPASTALNQAALAGNIASVCCPPAYQQTQNTERYQHLDDNPVHLVAEQPISTFQLTQYTLGRMAAQIAGARAITYAAARAFDEDERAAAPLAAQAKLLACDVAVAATQSGQLMHGGWGYAEEYPISRYVVDATVLPIFEGVKPILELKVIGRAILGA